MKKVLIKDLKGFKLYAVNDDLSVVELLNSYKCDVYAKKKVAHDVYIDNVYLNLFYRLDSDHPDKAHFIRLVKNEIKKAGK